MDLALDQRGADMVEMPGGAGGILRRDYKGKAEGPVTHSAPAVVSLVAELRGHERQAAEDWAREDAPRGAQAPRRHAAGNHIGRAPW